MPDRKEAIEALDRLSDEDLHDVVHRLVQDPRVRRRTGFKGWWQRYSGSVAFATLALAAVLGFIRVEGIANDADDFAVDLRDGLVRNCEQSGNPLRAAVRGVLRDQVQQSKSPALEEFFPQIPPDRLHELIHDANAQRRKAIQTLQPVDCQNLYPR